MKSVMRTFILLLLCSLLQLTASESSPVYMYPSIPAEEKTGDFIISLKDGVSSEDFQLVKNYAEAWSDDGKVRSSGLGVANYVTAKLRSYYSREVIRQMSQVDFIEEETVGRAHTVPYYLDRIDQVDLPLDNNEYNPINNGEGVDVYVFDGGIRYDHEEFEGRALYLGYDPVDNYHNESHRGNDCDGIGHGTHVASLVGGKTYGVAKRVQLYSVRILNCPGGESIATSVILDGINHAKALVDQRQRPAVFSVSAGYWRSQLLYNSIRSLYEAGIPLVASAGNRAMNACLYDYPGGSNYSITVGSSTADDEIVSNSNYGSCVDIFAPGGNILAATNTCPNCTISLTGTSQATPLVSGAAAIMLSQDNSLTPEEIRQGLILTSSKDVLDFSRLSQAFQNTTPNRLLQIPPKRGCHGTYYATSASGTIRPTIDDSTSNYLPNMNCEWIIVAPTGNTVTLNFPWVAVEANYDHVRICDGSSCVGTQQLDDLSGSFQNRQYESSGQYLTIVMTTDHIVNRAGFEASFSAQQSLGLSSSSPASSCSEVSSEVSGMYWIRAGSGNAIQVHCEFSPSCTCGAQIGSAWMRVANINMRDNSEGCPEGLKLKQSPVQSCERESKTSSCTTLTILTNSIPYGRVCGKVIGYQYGRLDGFRPSQWYLPASLDSYYVNGLSLTYGSPRKHVWTFVGADAEVENYYICPCTNINAPTQNNPVPSFVGNNYFCATGSTETSRSNNFYSGDPLWDGEGCGLTNNCCNKINNSDGYFCTDLGEQSTENLELRVCGPSYNDIPLEIVKIFVQ